MAANTEEVVRLIRIDTGESVKTVAELKKYIKDLKGGLEELEIGTEEYNTTLRALQSAQDAQKDSMNLGVQTVKAAKGSYNELVHTMRELKQEWRATADVQKRNELGKQINAINDQLKNLDSSVGVFTRNVGDYSNKFQEAFSALGSKAGAAAAGGVKQLGTALKVLSKTPVIAVLGVLIAIIEKVVSKMKESEEGTRQLASAMSVFQGIGVIVTKALENVGKAVGWLSDKFVGLLKKLNLYKAEMQESLNITNDELALEKKRRESIMQNADADKQIAELRAKSAESDKYSIQQRMGFLKEALSLEEQKAQREKDLAKQEYDLIVRRNAQTNSSTKDLQAEADAYARMVGAETAYLQTKRRTAKELESLRNKQKTEAKADKADADKAAKDEAAALNARLALEKDILAQELELTKKGTEERLNKQLELREKEKEIAEAKARQTIKDQDALNKQLDLLQKKYDNDVEKTRTSFEEERKETEAQRGRDRLEGDLALLEQNSTARLEKELELKAYEKETLFQYEEETDEAFRKRSLEAEKAYNDKRRELAEARVSIAQTWAGNITSLATSIADAYEAMSDNEEKAAEQTKGIRIAAAIIDTISGAIGAYMSAVSPTSGIPAPYNMILGAIQAATVTATGMANIAKLRAVNVKSGGGSVSSAAVTPPPVVQQAPVTRTLTSASEEERLDRMASKQRVVLVYSDVEDAANYVEVVQDETEF